MSSPRPQRPTTTQTQTTSLTESQILAKKLPLTTWNNLNPAPALENQKKYHNKLMKPLQINHKRKLLTLASNKNHQKYVEEPFQEAEELLTRVSEIKKISRVQGKMMGIRKSDNGESNGDSLLRLNLSEDAFKCIELARETAQVQQNETNSSRLYNSVNEIKEKTENNKAGSVERTSKHDHKQKRLATQLSNQMDKKVPKQLNSSAHFRHAKRKILLLRALDSVVNQQENIKEVLSDVKSCREAAEIVTVGSRERSSESYGSGSLNSLRSFSKGREIQQAAHEVPVSKFALENAQNAQKQQYYLPMSNYDSGIESINDITAPPKHRIPRSENCLPTTPKSRTVIISHKKSPVGSISHFLRDNEYFNNSQEIEKSQVYVKSAEKEERLMRIPTLDSVTYDFGKTLCHSTKSQWLSNDEDIMSQTRTTFSGGRPKPNRTKQKIMTEFQEQRDKTFRNELRLTMRNEPVSLCGQASMKGSALRNSKSVNMLKHIRRVSSSFENRSMRREFKEKTRDTPSQSTTPRKKSDILSSENAKVVQKMIRSGFRDDSTEKEPGKKEAEAILNSYGFKDTTEELRRSRIKQRFSTLEGYQGAFLKEALARTQRQLDGTKKKDNKDKVLCEKGRFLSRALFCV